MLRNITYTGHISGMMSINQKCLNSRFQFDDEKCKRFSFIMDETNHPHISMNLIGVSSKHHSKLMHWTISLRSRSIQILYTKEFRPSNQWLVLNFNHRASRINKSFYENNLYQNLRCQQMLNCLNWCENEKEFINQTNKKRWYW